MINNGSTKPRVFFLLQQTRRLISIRFWKKIFKSMIVCIRYLTSAGDGRSTSSQGGWMCCIETAVDQTYGHVNFGGKQPTGQWISLTVSHSVEQSVCQYVRYDRYKWIKKIYLKNHPEQVKGNESTSITLQPEVGSEKEGAVGYYCFWVPILELQLLFLILYSILHSPSECKYSTRNNRIS